MARAFWVGAVWAEGLLLCQGGMAVGRAMFCDQLCQILRGTRTPREKLLEKRFLLSTKYGRRLSDLIRKYTGL